MRSRFMRREDVERWWGYWGGESQRCYGVGCIAEAWRWSAATATVLYCKDDGATLRGRTFWPRPNKLSLIPATQLRQSPPYHHLQIDYVSSRRPAAQAVHQAPSLKPPFPLRAWSDLPISHTFHPKAAFSYESYVELPLLELPLPNRRI